MPTEAFRACSLGPSRPSVRPGSPGRAGFRAREREISARARNQPHTYFWETSSQLGRVKKVVFFGTEKVVFLVERNRGTKNFDSCAELKI